jgi:hypothetical protein
LYGANHFSFKGARGVLAMKSCVTALQWHNLRHIYISTMLCAPVECFRNFSGFPPDGLIQWTEGCKALQDMQSLRSLHFDLIVWTTLRREIPSDEKSLISILEPLQNLDASIFVVELNMPLPERVRVALGDIKFTLVVKQRPFNFSTFPV